MERLGLNPGQTLAHHSSSASADPVVPVVPGGPARNLTVNAGNTERTRVTVTLPPGFELPGHGSCAGASASERDCVVTIRGGGSGTRRIAAGVGVAAGTHAISVGGRSTEAAARVIVPQPACPAQPAHSRKTP